MHKDILKNIPFFKCKETSFVAHIGPLLKEMKVSKGEIIFMEGDPAEEIFFIKSGKVAGIIPHVINI